MNRLRVFALAGFGLLGLSFGSAQAGWHYRPVACAPVVTCAPAPVVTCAPAPCPVVVAPVVRTYYRPVVYCGRRVVHVRRCR